MFTFDIGCVVGVGPCKSPDDGVLIFCGTAAARVIGKVEEHLLLNALPSRWFFCFSFAFCGATTLTQWVGWDWSIASSPSGNVRESFWSVERTAQRAASISR